MPIHKDWGTPPNATPLEDFRAIRDAVVAYEQSASTMYMNPHTYAVLTEIERYNALLKTLPWWHYRRVARALRNLRYLWEV